MSLFASLYTGVSGLNAQSQHTAAISTNIANSTTVGYKKTDTVFQDLVVNKTRPNNFAHGGVLSDQILRTERQGALQQTANRTDIGILGDGFFAVKPNDNPELEFLYTRNGSFVPDADGFLRNSSGFMLFGWPVDSNGNVIAGNTLDSLQPVDVDEFNALHRPTTTAELAINLDASEALTNPDLLFPPQSLPINGATVADFSRTFNVVDGDGVTRGLVFEFRHVTGPMASAATGVTGVDFLTSLTDPIFFSGINPGDSFSVSVGGTTQEYIIGAPAGGGQIRVDTIGDLANEINSVFGGGNTLDMSIDADGRLTFQAIDPTATITFAETSGTPLTGGNSLNMVTQFGGAPLTYTPQTAINGGDYPGQGNFPAIANQANPSTRGWWEVTILTRDPADPNNPAAALVPVTSGLMSFNSDGTLNAAPDADGNIQINLNGINFNDASVSDTANIVIDVNRFSQFSGAYNVLIQNQNGAEAGTLTDVTIDREGRVIATFTNSEQFQIFQVPLAIFTNPNGLESMSGTVFAETEESGVPNVVQAGTGGAGVVEGSTVEQSNVDLAEEFSNLIVSQRAFSANSRLINTVDEMTEQLRQLKS